MHGYINRSGTYWSDTETQHHPVRGGWWTGVPQELGQAIVVGNPYLDLWPRVKENGLIDDNLCFLSTKSWGREESVNSLVGPVPKDIAQLKIPKWIKLSGGAKTIDYNDEYPAKFPFNKQVENFK